MTDVGEFAIRHKRKVRLTERVKAYGYENAQRGIFHDEMLYFMNACALDSSRHDATAIGSHIKNTDRVGLAAILSAIVLVQYVRQ